MMEEEKALENLNEEAASDVDRDQEEVKVPAASQRSIDFLLDVPLEISVEVGRTRILVKDLLQMQDGYVVELDKAAGKPLDLYVNSKLIAKGEPVLVNDKFGLRLTDVITPAERIEKLEE
jgi:flagellar motor switch protein FliN/FliY